MFQFKEINESLFDGNRGFAGIGLLNNKYPINMGVLLRTCAIYNFNFAFTIGARYKPQQSDTTKSHKHIPIFNFDSFDIFKKTLSLNSEIVAVEMTNKARYLHQFTHPERAIYLLGAEDFGIPQEILNKCHHVVKLPGEISLNVGVCGSIVAYDRQIKRKKYL